MKKIKLYMVNKDNTEDIFEFNSMNDLLLFINQLTVEKLIDSNFAELEYNIIVDDVE
jgi:hypothetical protein